MSSADGICVACDEAASHRGLTTNNARGVDTRSRRRSEYDVAALSLLFVPSAGTFPERNENAPETSWFSRVETGARVHDSRRGVANHDMSRRFSSTVREPLCGSHNYWEYIL
jgi:hypothetical protein